MITIIRTNAENLDFQQLVNDLNADLKIRDGEDHAFYNQYNGIDTIKYVVVAYHKNIPVGCGAVKHYDESTMEIKRMFVPLYVRGQGIASFVLKELEVWSKELGYSKCILETGKQQPEAIQLYDKNNYLLIPNFGQYAGIDNSVCFQKNL